MNEFLEESGRLFFEDLFFKNLMDWNVHMRKDFTLVMCSISKYYYLHKSQNGRSVPELTAMDHRDMLLTNEFE